MSKVDVVVTGATGKVGSQLLRSLVHRKNLAVRALMRDKSKARWAADAGVDLVEGSLDDTATASQAMKGVHTLALITPAGARAAEQAGKLVAAAREAGVARIVRLSAIKASVDGPTDNTRQHGITEAAIRASGMKYVFLRPNYYMQNLLGNLGTILGQGKLYGGVDAAKIALVDARDVGEAMAGAISTSAFDGSEFELSGPESISHESIAAEIGKALGRHVAYVPIPPQAAGEAMRAFGADEWTVKLIADYCRAYTNGFGDFTTDAVRSLTGQAPRSIATFAHEILAPAAALELTPEVSAPGKRAQAG